MDTFVRKADGVVEFNRHNELLARAASRVGELADVGSQRQQLVELLDWMAYFTREHFGFHERLLAECGEQREYLLSRAAVHGEFRRQLAQLFIDGTRGDCTVPERLRDLCQRLLEDARAEQEAFSELLLTSGKPTRLRADRRRRPLSAEVDQFVGPGVSRHSSH